MKQLIFYFLLVSNASFSQIEIYNLGLTDTTQKVMYNRHENIFKVYGVDIDSTFTLRHGSDTLNYFYGKFYLGRFHSKSDTLKLFKNKTLLKISCFEQREMPKLNYHLGGIRDSLVTKSELINAFKKGGVYPTYNPEIAYCNTWVKGFREVHFIKRNGRVIKIDKNKDDKRIDRLYDKIMNWSDEKWEKNRNKKWITKRLNSTSSQMKCLENKISKMKSGDVFCIPLIKLSCSSGVGRLHYVNFRFRIK